MKPVELKTALLLLWVGGMACRSLPLSELSPGEADAANLFSIVWATPLVAPGFFEYEPLEFATPWIDTERGRIYTYTRDGVVRALSAEDGKVLWASKPMGKSFAGVAAEGKLVFIPGGDGILRALYAEDGDRGAGEGWQAGQEKWAVDMGEEWLTRPVVVGGKLLVVSQTDGLFVLETETGQRLWQYKRKQPAGFTVRGAFLPAVLGSTVYQGFSDGSLLALNLEDGEVLWEKNTSPSGGTAFLDLDSGAAFSEDGALMYVASYKDGLFAIATATGDFLWTQRMHAATYVGLRGNLLLTAGGFGISAHSAEDGTRLWNTSVLTPRPPTATRRKPIGDSANSGRLPAIYGRWLMVPTSGDLGFFDMVSGKPMGYWNPGQGVSATPAVWNNHVYVLSNQGHLYALKMVRWSS